MRRRILHRSAREQAQRDESVVCQIMECACVRVRAGTWINCVD
jgi:hypothetical protein